MIIVCIKKIAILKCKIFTAFTEISFVYPSRFVNVKAKSKEGKPMNASQALKIWLDYHLIFVFSIIDFPMLNNSVTRPIEYV